MPAPAHPVVWVPSREGAALLGELPPHLHLDVWDGIGDRPETPVHFLVPPFLGRQASLEGLPELQVIQLLSAGAEVVLPHVPPGVTLCTARGAHSGSTAEWAMAAILGAQRDLPAFRDTARDHRWDQRTTRSLAGSTVLIVGYGDIGEALERRLAPFEVTVTRVARNARHGIHAISELPTLLPDADVVVLLTPLTDETRGLVDAAFLKAMKQDALLVNAARGQVVVTDALVEALHSRTIRAALDVTDPEPLPTDHPLWDAPGLLLTPHVAGATPGTGPRAYAVVRANLDRWLRDEPLSNVVTPAGY